MRELGRNLVGKDCRSARLFVETIGHVFIDWPPGRDPCWIGTDMVSTIEATKSVKNALRTHARIFRRPRPMPTPSMAIKWKDRYGTMCLEGRAVTEEATTNNILKIPRAHHSNYLTAVMILTEYLVV